MADTHIILAPKRRYYDWARAARDYAVKFGVGITSDPETAATPPNTVVTIANPTDGYGRDIIVWFKFNYPELRLDVVDAQTPDEFAELLSVRTRSGLEYGVEV